MRSLLKILFTVALMLIASLWTLAPHGAFSAPVSGNAQLQMSMSANALADGPLHNGETASASRRIQGQWIQDQWIQDQWIQGQNISIYQDCPAHPEHSCGAYAMFPGAALTPVTRMLKDKGERGTAVIISARWAPPGKPPRA